MNRFWRNSEGATLLEFTVVFPVFMLIVFGTVDVTLMLFDWAIASKAAYMGARAAVVSAPVPTGITWTYSTVATQAGARCTNSADGTNNSTANCPAVSTVCTPSAGTGGACTGGYTFSNANFTPILARMQAVFPAMTRQNVQITYQTAGLGYVGRPGGLPMNVTVSIRCMSHEFFFLGALMGWAFPPLPNGCPTPLATNGWALPTFSTTLTGEDLVTN